MGLKSLASSLPRQKTISISEWMSSVSCLGFYGRPDINCKEKWTEVSWRYICMAREPCLVDGSYFGMNVK
jgi:hypothetical protein